MTNLEQLQSMSLDAFAEWLDKHGQFDDSPWMNWFNETYCTKCESIKCKIESTNIGLSPLYPEQEVNCAYCELNKNCKFFPESEEVPDTKSVLKLWLELEVK